MFLAGTWAVYKIGFWYMYTLTTPERTGEVSAFVAVTIGAWTKLMDYYMKNGVDWTKRNMIVGDEDASTSNDPPVT